MALRHLGLVVLGIALAACSFADRSVVDVQEATPEGPIMLLTSAAFDDGGPIPAKYTCDGDDVSPPLAWTDVPPDTRAFALIVTDPDAGGFVHWVLTDIPGDARELAEGQGDTTGVAGRTSFSDVGWGGPCPPSGEHRYVFELLALSEPLVQDPGVVLDAAAVRSMAEGRTLARGELTGTYARR
jgi:Raf kinase inhibitor-like YbhB/YbcL family protein